MAGYSIRSGDVSKPTFTVARRLRPRPNLRRPATKPPDCTCDPGQRRNWWTPYRQDRQVDGCDEGLCSTWRQSDESHMLTLGKTAA